MKAATKLSRKLHASSLSISARELLLYKVVCFMYATRSKLKCFVNRSSSLSEQRMKRYM